MGLAWLLFHNKSWCIMDPPSTYMLMLVLILEIPFSMYLFRINTRYTYQRRHFITKQNKTKTSLTLKTYCMNYLCFFPVIFGSDSERWLVYLQCTFLSHRNSEILYSLSYSFGKRQDILQAKEANYKVG